MDNVQHETWDAYGYASLPAISPSIGAGGPVVPNTFERDGFRFFRDASSVLINLFSDEFDCRCSDLFRLLVGSA